jgi:hypothetical protein
MDPRASLNMVAKTKNKILAPVGNRTPAVQTLQRCSATVYAIPIHNLVLVRESEF